MPDYFPGSDYVADRWDGAETDTEGRYVDSGCLPKVRYAFPREKRDRRKAR